MQAEASGQALADTGSVDPNDRSRVVCKSIHKTGTRLHVEKQCMTVGQREAMAKNASRATERVQNSGCVKTVTNPCGGR